jgi:hypothetical protein
VAHLLAFAEIRTNGLCIMYYVLCIDAGLSTSHTVINTRSGVEIRGGMGEGGGLSSDRRYI